MRALQYQEFSSSTRRRLAAAFPMERGGHPGFPGRWVGGTAMVAGPLLLLAGVLLRLPFPFFFPDQLAAFEAHPAVISGAYRAFVAGNLLMWPAVAALAGRIGTRCPGWAMWGAILVTCGLFARTFHAGVDHLAFQLVRVQGLDSATQAVAASYGANHLFKIFNGAILAGWLVLAIGAYRSRVLGRFRSIALALMATLPLGVLKGSTAFSVVATVGLCVAFVPLGLGVLADRPRPTPGSALRWILLLAGLGVALYLFGQAG